MLPVPQNIAESYSDVVFANEDSIRRTVATATAEQKSFLQKMVDYLKDFIKSIKKLIDLSIEIESNKTSSVDLISFYVTKKHNKKGSQSVPPATQGSFSGGARLPNSNVPQNTQSVNNNDMQNEKQDSSLQIDAEKKTKYSRQLLNATWDDIRDKMYENEVHEDIIGESEAYIKKLTARKLARETAVTEGLIPKYEAILKVAREYTKGSEVSAQQLADTINDLMWAAIL